MARIAAQRAGGRRAVAHEARKKKNPVALNTTGL